MAAARGAPESRLAGWGLQWAPGREIRSESLVDVTRSVPLTRGLGRSYGDASLPPADRPVVAGSRLADRILAFDESTGILRAEAGLSLGELTRLFRPRGWTSPVLTGTRYVTLGGMVAADVHGKNHHRDGSFGHWVESLLVRVGTGEVVRCSGSENPDLFRASIGGLGLVGHVLEVELRLRAIPSPWILQEMRRVPDLDALLENMARAREEWPMTVAWVDTLAEGRSLGRGLLVCGRWAEPSEAPAKAPARTRSIPVPFTFPEFALSRWSMRVFNQGIYRSRFRDVTAGIVHPDSYFHPLDWMGDWNRVYGRRGMTQHQCVLPRELGSAGVRRFLKAVSEEGVPSFLTVVKDLGEAGPGVLSFPLAGTTINLDLPVRPGLAEVLDRLNELVLELGGRIYLAKDAFTKREHFRAMEGDRLLEFERIRDRWDPERKLASALSRRLFDDPGRAACDGEASPRAERTERW